MRLYRISKPEHVPTALHGIGAARVPGRWNSPGVPIAYTATSVSLAMLEILVHVGREDVPAGQRILTFDVPDDAIYSLPSAQWPSGWDKLPYSATVRAVGDAFVRDATHLAMKVPSAVVRDEFNVLINPAHARMSEIKLVVNDLLALDERLFR